MEGRMSKSAAMGAGLGASRNQARVANSSRRRRRRRGKYTLHYILIILFLLAVGITLSLTVLFKVEAVTVVGTDKYDPTELALASGIEEGDNLLRLSGEEVEQRIMEQYPYIASVEIRRKIPPAVEIQVTQFQPDGAILQDGEVTLITGDGKILEKGNLLVPDDIPLIQGLDVSGLSPGDYLDESSQEGLIMFQYLLDAIRQTGFNDITNVDLSDRLDMQVIYENRILLRLGSEADLVYKLRFVKEVLDTKIEPDETGVLDAGEAGNKNRVRFKPGSIREETVQPQQNEVVETSQSETVEFGDDEL